MLENEDVVRYTRFNDFKESNFNIVIVKKVDVFVDIFKCEEEIEIFLVVDGVKLGLRVRINVKIVEDK